MTHAPVSCHKCYRAAVPNLSGTRDQFHGRQFFHRPGARRWFGDDSSALHLLCPLFLLLLHQLRLRSSGIKSLKWGTPVEWRRECTQSVSMAPVNINLKILTSAPTPGHILPWAIHKWVGQRTQMKSDFWIAATGLLNKANIMRVEPSLTIWGHH